MTREVESTGGSMMCTLTLKKKKSILHRIGTQTREPAEPPMECKSQWQEHIQQSCRSKVSINNSKASFRLQITMAETHKGAGARRRQSWQALQQSLLPSANHNGRETHKSRRPKASIVASVAAESPIEWKSSH